MKKPNSSLPDGYDYTIEVEKQDGGLDFRLSLHGMEPVLRLQLHTLIMALCAERAEAGNDGQTDS